MQSIICILHTKYTRTAIYIEHVDLIKRKRQKAIDREGKGEKNKQRTILNLNHLEDRQTTNRRP